jgi:hypothetical protein
MSKFESYIVIATYIFSNATIVMFYKDALRSGSLETYSVAGLQLWTMFFSLWPFLDPMQSWLYTFFQMTIIYFITKNVRSRYALTLLNLLGIGLFFILAQEYIYILRFLLRLQKTLFSVSGILAFLIIVLIVLVIALLKYKKSNIFFICFVVLIIILLVISILLLDYKDYAINLASQRSFVNDKQALWSLMQNFFEQANPSLKAEINDMLLTWYGPSNDRGSLIYTINMLVKQVDPASAQNIQDIIEILSEVNELAAISEVRHFVYLVIKDMLLTYLCVITILYQYYCRKK